MSGDSGGYVVWGCGGVDVREEAAVGVPVQDGFGVAVVGQEAFGDDVRVGVVRSASVGEALEEGGERHDEEDDEFDCSRSKLFEDLCLSECARETVEEHCGGSAVLSELRGDDFGHVVVGNEPAGFERGAYS